MSIMGVTYSILASSLWPMVSIVIPDHQLGTAYGLMQSIQNLGLAVISIAAGAIVDAKGDKIACHTLSYHVVSIQCFEAKVH